MWLNFNCPLGLALMDAEDYPQAMDVLQEAASSLCSSKILAEIYTCLGLSFYKMVLLVAKIDMLESLPVPCVKETK